MSYMSDMCSYTSDLKTYRILPNQLTIYLEIQGYPNRKQKKKTFTWQWRNCKEKQRLKKNGGQMKRQVEVIRELKTGILVLQTYSY